MALAVCLGGCVSAGKYKSALEESQNLQNKVSALAGELESLKSSSAAQLRSDEDKASALQAQLKAAEDKFQAAEDKAKAGEAAAAALRKAQADLEKEFKDAKKVGELLKSDNERLEKSLQDRRDEYGKASAKVRAALDGLRETVDAADKALK